jgi:zinc protease
VETILGGGKTSRLYRGLVEGAEIASSVGADHTAGRYPGWFAVQLELLPGKDRKQAEKLLLAELQKLRDKPPSAGEVKRAQHQILASYIFRREGVQNLADSIGQAAVLQDLDALKNYLPKIMAVTPADVQRVAKKYLNPATRVSVWSVPPVRKADQGGAFRRFGLVWHTNPKRQRGNDHPLADASGLRGPLAYASGWYGRRAGGAAPGEFDLKKAQRVVLPNGLVLLLFENRRLPIFEAHASFQDVALYQTNDQLGVARLTGTLLDEGTAKRSGSQIAEAMENVGGVLSLGGSGGSVRVLSADRALGLELLLECLMQPSFPRDAFARLKARQLAEIVEAETQPDTRASRAFYAAVYGKHPLGRPSLGTTRTVKALTRNDCVEFHRKVFVPNNLVLAIVGDFDAKTVIAEVKRLTAKWEKSSLKRPPLPEVTKPKEFTQSILTMPESSQLHFYMGHAGVRRNNPDYYKLLVMDYVLGTGDGFTDRLSSRLRDREGLAYSVSANITSSASVEPGVFACYIGTGKENFARVKKLFLEELQRIRDEKPTAREVADVKAYLLGSQMLRFATNAGIANQLLAIERYKLGFDYLETFRKAVTAVTPEDVQAVAKKYLDPKRMVLVAAGAIDKDGKPVERLPKPKK